MTPTPTAAELREWAADCDEQCLSATGEKIRDATGDMLRAGADAMDALDAARARIAELEAGLEACDVSMETCATLGYAQLMPDVYRDSWARAAIEARRLLAAKPDGGA